MAVTSKPRMTLANGLTLVRMALAPALLALLYVGTLAADLAALLVLAVAGATDLLDGHLARRHGATSAFGKIADPLSDSFVFLALFGGFVVAGWMAVWVFAVFLAREAFMHAYLRPCFLVRGVALGAKRFGKAKTLLQSVVGVGVLLALLATRGLPLRPDSTKAALMGAAHWALLATAAVSVLSLRPYVAELCRLRGSGARPAEEGEAS